MGKIINQMIDQEEQEKPKEGLNNMDILTNTVNNILERNKVFDSDAPVGLRCICLLMMKQVSAMTKAVTMRDDFVIRILGILNFGFAILHTYGNIYLVIWQIHNHKHRRVLGSNNLVQAQTIVYSGITSDDSDPVTVRC